MEIRVRGRDHLSMLACGTGVQALTRPGEKETKPTNATEWFGPTMPRQDTASSLGRAESDDVMPGLKDSPAMHSQARR